MSGLVFEHLSALRYVNLEANECINQKFGEVEIRGISRAVNGTCGFDRNGTQIACEKIFFNPWVGDFLCIMNSYTVINNNNYTISDPFNVRVERMEFSENRYIEFLPILLHQKFPNIKKYYAARCAIKEITKQNFKNLLKLREVNLAGNQIYAVLSDIFKGIERLFKLNLSKFKLMCLTIIQSYLQFLEKKR